MSKKIITTIDIRHGGSLLELKQRIDDYIEKGYTKYDCEIEQGYYADIEEVNLEIKK